MSNYSVYGIYSKTPDLIAHTEPNRLVPLTYVQDNPNITCGPWSDKYPETNPNSGTCRGDIPSKDSTCNDAALQNMGREKCINTEDDSNLRKPCKWTEPSRSGKQVKGADGWVGNLIIPLTKETVPVAGGVDQVISGVDEYIQDIDWVTQLNGRCVPSPSPAYIKCGAPPIPSPFAPAPTPLSICTAPNPWGDPRPVLDSTCAIFYTPPFRDYMYRTQEGGLSSAYINYSDAAKPTLYNNLPLNYVYKNPDTGETSNASYCYKPGPGSCQEIGGYKGEALGLASATMTTPYLPYSDDPLYNTANVLCKYTAPTSEFVNNQFLKNGKDMLKYSNLIGGHDEFYNAYKVTGLPYSSEMYQYLIMNYCLSPVDYTEVDKCYGIGTQYNAQTIYPRENPAGIKPRYYWNENYQLDPYLEAKFIYAPSPSGDRPIAFSPDSPRCMRLNKNSGDGQACRKWYKNTLNIPYNRLKMWSQQPQGNPEYSECALSPTCDPVKLNLPEWLPPMFPIKSPNGETDWVATRENFPMGSAPGSTSRNFNKTVKDICNKPYNQYTWECGCINSSNPDNPNYYYNLYKNMNIGTPPPGYSEGYFGPDNQEDAKYCWMRPCKFPLGSAGLGMEDLNNPVRLADPTYSTQADFFNQNGSLCPQYDCQSIVITTPGSEINPEIIRQVAGMTSKDSNEVCSSVENSFWVDSAIGCTYGPNPYPSPATADYKDPGYFCRQLPPGNLMRFNDANAYMHTQQCLNACSNVKGSVYIPPEPIPYSYPTFKCYSDGTCKQFVQDKYNPLGTKGEFFDMDECKEQCLNATKSNYMWIIIIVVAILAGIIIFFIIRNIIKTKKRKKNI